MASYGKDSKLSPERVLEKAAEYFGPGGLGLEIQEQGGGCARFVGGGGHVYVQTCAADNGTQVDLETREWDRQVLQFMSKI